LDFWARGYDSRIGKWWSVDPYDGAFPNTSPFAFVVDSPIKNIDFGGKFPLSHTIRSKYPRVAAMLDDYFDSMAENEAIVSSFKISEDQIIAVFKARSPEELNQDIFNGGVIMEISVRDIYEYKEVYGEFPEWFDEPEIRPGFEAETKRKGEVNDKFAIIMIQNRFFRDLESELASCPEFDDITHGEKEITIYEEDSPRVYALLGRDVRLPSG